MKETCWCVHHKHPNDRTGGMCSMCGCRYETKMNQYGDCCDEYSYDIDAYDDSDWKYCPHCGSKLVKKKKHLLSKEQI